MADLVFGFGTSHGPLLTIDPEIWGRSRTADMMEIPRIHFRGDTYSYEELLTLRGAANFAEQNSLATRQAAFADCQRALDALAARIREARLDAMIIIGDDHYEYFRRDIQPPFAVYCGESLVNCGFDPGARTDLPEAVCEILAASCPPQDEAYPVASGLALEIITQGIRDGFDVTSSEVQPVDPEGLRGIGHAVGFIVRRLLDDRPMALVPVLMNTYFEPNQPPVRRCFEFGRSMGRAVKTWKQDVRVAVAGSGGLTHFAIDEELDMRLLRALRERDLDTLLSVPENVLQAGTSEYKNWIAALGVLWETDLEMDLIDYVPCYRSEAGTGAGMGFAAWTPAGTGG